ncbi:hypothetical protein BGZ94_008643 [Podila epigama]|nr:hypothetical protein BGZ94_008643 [Podila epigama]
MSFTDLDRSLSTPPRSPNDPYAKNHMPLGKSSNMSKDYHSSGLNSPLSPLSPTSPAGLPNAFQVTRGSSRDSVGLSHHFNLDDHPDPYARLGPIVVHPPPPKSSSPPPLSSHGPYPPPVSPNRKPTLQHAQHSRILQDNTRIDTPRPTLTSSSPSAAPFLQTGKSTAPGPLSPRQLKPFSTTTAATTTTMNTTQTQSRTHHQIQIQGDRGNHNNIDQQHNTKDRQQVLSPPRNPAQFSPSFSRHGAFTRGPQEIPNSSHDGDVSTRQVTSSENNNNNSIKRDVARDGGRPLSSSSPSPSPSSPSFQNQEHDYDLLVRHVSQQIFNISSNVAVLERLAPCLGHRQKDTKEMRASLRSVMDTTQDLVKSAHAQMKVLGRYHHASAFLPSSSSPPPSSSASSSASTPSSRAAAVVRNNSLLSSTEATSLAPSHNQQQQQQQQNGSSSSSFSMDQDQEAWRHKVLTSRRMTYQRLVKDLGLVSKSFQDLQRQVIQAERLQVATLRRLSTSASLKRHQDRMVDLSQGRQEEVDAAATAAAGSVDGAALEQKRPLLQDSHRVGGRSGYNSFSGMSGVSVVSARESTYGSVDHSGALPISVTVIPRGEIPLDQGMVQKKTSSYYQGSHHRHPTAKSASTGVLVHDRELSLQEQNLLQELLVMDGELAIQEAILQERESEIFKIEQGMDQVLEVMRELGTLVLDQRGQMDFLQDNIMQTHGRMYQAQQEVIKASDYQRQSREQLCYFLLIASIVGAIITFVLM